MDSMKEKATNIAASAKARLAKTIAVVQEKVKRLTANNPAEKEMATEKKQDKIKQAEYNKHNASNPRTKDSTSGYAPPHHS